MTQGSGKPTGTNYLPYVLIGIGAVILIGNLGGGFDPLIRFFGSILSLWPIVLIAIGVDMITSGRYRLIVVGAAVAVGLVLTFAPGSLGGVMSRVGERQDVTIALESASRLDLDIDLGVARLVLGSSPGMTQAVSGTVQPSRGERFEQQFQRRGATLDVELRSRNAGGPFGVGFIGGTGGGTWDLRLTERVPIDLDIDAGVGGSELDLRGLQLAAFDLDAGVGSVEVTLPGGDYQASIDGGVGSITIRLPAGAPARIDVDTGLGGVSADAAFQRSGDVYTTANYDGSGVRLAVSAGVGQVRIETTR